MSNDLSRALAKTQSLKLSVMNAIIELETAAAEALAAGEDVKSAQLSLKAGELAVEAVSIRKAEDDLRRRIGLGPKIAQLETLSNRARGVLAAIRRGTDLLRQATQLVAILGNVARIAAWRAPQR